MSEWPRLALSVQLLLRGQEAIDITSWQRRQACEENIPNSSLTFLNQHGRDFESILIRSSKLACQLL